MNAETPPRSDDALPALAAFALCGAAGVLGAALVFGRRQEGGALLEPFVWWDVLLAYVLGAIPATAHFAAGIRRRMTAPVVLGIALAPLWLARQSYGLDVDSILPAALWRPLAALSIALAASLGVAGIVRRPLRPARGRGWGSAASTLALCVTFAWLVPGAYAATRMRQHIGRLQQLLDEARFGEARRLAHALQAFDPSLWLTGIPPDPRRETPLSTLVPMLDEQVRELEARVSRPLAPDASDLERLARAEELSLLGRDPDAAAILAPLAGREPPDPRAWGLLGVIHETQEDYAAARAAFDRAARLWEARPASDQRFAGLVQAVRGTAYAERKLGRYREAEAAYQRLLAISPTADTHFLLAKFYEDTQQAGAAREHARRAIELAPEAYNAPGRELIDALAVRHFGCLPVYLDERTTTTARP